MRYIRYTVLLLCAFFVLATRYVTGVGEWYALHLYPLISYSLSAVSSIVPFSLEEWIVILSACFLLVCPIVGIVRKRSLWKVVGVELEIALGLYVWFYLGWGCNYYRTDFYSRCEVSPVTTDEDQFRKYLNEFADSLNLYYVEEIALSHTEIEQKVKDQFRQLSPSFGLCQPQDFQHPKYLVFNRLYSAVGVLGYMGPFMAESQVNLQLLPAQYPFTYAHELSHLLGISSEAEANYWAYYVCTNSPDPQLRYSGYFCLLPYLINNAYAILSAEDYQSWFSHIDAHIIAEMKAQSQFWRSQQITWVNDLQESFYDWYLRSNQVPSGRANYNQVVQMIMSVRTCNSQLSR